MTFTATAGALLAIRDDASRGLRQAIDAVLDPTGPPRPTSYERLPLVLSYRHAEEVEALILADPVALGIETEPTIGDEP